MHVTFDCYEPLRGGEDPATLTIADRGVSGKEYALACAHGVARTSNQDVTSSDAEICQVLVILHGCQFNCACLADIEERYGPPFDYRAAVAAMGARG